jgi:hypothetical protein
MAYGSTDYRARTGAEKSADACAFFPLAKRLPGTSAYE